MKRKRILKTIGKIGIVLAGFVLVLILANLPIHSEISQMVILVCGGISLANLARLLFMDEILDRMYRD